MAQLAVQHSKGDDRAQGPPQPHLDLGRNHSHRFSVLSKTMHGEDGDLFGRRELQPRYGFAL